jgi:DNA polymerase-3 subunit epsilon/oligoribonuclease
MFWSLQIKAGKNQPHKMPWKLGISKDQIAASRSIPPEAFPHRAMSGVSHLIACDKAVV